MTIACLGWGSLIDHPRGLKIRGGWKPDGPSLPVEFLRRSDDGRLTLVLTECGEPTRVLWSVMSLETVDACAEDLRQRECPKRPDWIGWWSPDGNSGHWHADTIGAWAEGQALKGVVWAALPAKWQGKNNVAPTLEEAFAYLRGLAGNQLADARDYILGAPPQVQTGWRASLEAALNRKDN